MMITEPKVYVLCDEKDMIALRKLASSKPRRVLVSRDYGGEEYGWLSLYRLRISEDGKLQADLEP